MMNYSTNDELEAIERSARMASSTSSPKEDNRRGSSMFAVHDPSGDLLVDFPGGGEQNYKYENPDTDHKLTTSKSLPPTKVNPISAAASSSVGGGGGPRRDSVILQPMAGLGGLIDFDDSDFEDSEDEDVPAYSSDLPGAPARGTGSAAHGGPNHRPMVGGFAAAAYEAARAYHYQGAGKSDVVLPKRTGPPPSI